jgi:hypothetical protein
MVGLAEASLGKKYHISKTTTAINIRKADFAFLLFVNLLL